MNEVETKVLDIDEAALRAKLAQLGAKEVADGRLIVDWYGVRDVSAEDQPWRLRIRTGHGKNEVTWKGKATSIPGALTRTVEELQTTVFDAAVLGAIFEKLGLERSAHQEKDRTSFIYKEWRFDIDRYPGIPAFVEIEGSSEEHIAEAMQLLDLVGHRTWTTGERRLIEQVYGKVWHQMHFAEEKETNEK